MSIQASFSLQLSNFHLDIDLFLPDRGVIALFGPSGSGKTTTLRCLAGLQRSVGHLVVNNETWQDDARGIFRPAHQRSIGYVFQEANLFPHLSVAANLRYAEKRSRPVNGSHPPSLTDLAPLFHLEPLLQRMPARLSGGERQRAAMVRALLTNPKLLLMDEPLAALDQTSREEILSYLERLNRELAIPMVYVSHHEDEVQRLADAIVTIEQGYARGTRACGNKEMTFRVHSPSNF